MVDQKKISRFEQYLQKEKAGLVTFTTYYVYFYSNISAERDSMFSNYKFRVSI